MNEIDDLKQLRLQEEKRFINNEFIEALAQQLIDSLVKWSNEEIFEPKGGKLSFEMTLGPPNAGVAISPSRPLFPRVEFRTSLISEIYADAFSFPLVCRRIGMETDTLKNFNDIEGFLDCQVRFTDPIPQLNESYVAEIFRLQCSTMIEVLGEQRERDHQIQANDVRCRFIMFELMLVWTFFHELGHVAQGHHLMHSGGKSKVHDYSFLEIDEVAVDLNNSANMSSVPQDAAKSVPPDLPAQARELMADAEAMDLTLKYLVKDRRLNFKVLYLLVCSIGCMFQRFYSHYPDNLDISSGRHPHPVIRDESSHLLGNNWVADFLVASKNIENRGDASMPMAYLSVRASLMTGLFRAHRIERRKNPEILPSYMGLLRDGGEQRRSYFSVLVPEIERQLPIAVSQHLIKLNSLEYWFQLFKASANREDSPDSQNTGPV
ncbi:hypothetical protein O3297_00630 [Janthinobacterium sp. SUN128]|uniref:hypothetical protein n=1 Tax=Janthinobacterium sp. SUN128 TaxID=3014790 RepID=UPI002713914C|nr:hypothetical protein [Janthinobacterium sp. SUN128]MDO8031906.1 hypothetical protein [Janthinobacterium sp. SUN128]